MAIGWAIIWATLAAVGEGSPSSLLAVQESVAVRTLEDQPTRLDLSAPDKDRRYLLVAGSLAVSAEPFTVRIDRQTKNASDEEAIAWDRGIAPEWWRFRVEQDREQMQRARVSGPSTAGYVSAKFAPKRSFHLFVGEDNLYDTKKYATVEAELVRVGTYCLIYADPATRTKSALIDDVARTFDERVFPQMSRRFGEHRDVDRNGKFTILVTDWLNRLSDGKVVLSGFVRGADFYRDVEPPFSNQCDMMYVNGSLEPGPHLRTIIAHEYTHAITFSEHTFGQYLPGGQGRDEEAWLGEGMAHVAENIAGEGWSNLDYRISTYLTQPNRYRLVVPDYFQDGLWRSHGCRGATYLFLRYCVDRFGPGLLEELSKSNLEGIANLETATQTPFAELFRGWSQSLATASATASDSSAAGPIRGRVGDRLLAGALMTDVPVGERYVSLAGTSWVGLVVHVRTGERSVIEVAAPADAKLQLTLVRLPTPNATSAIEVVTSESTHQVTIGLSNEEGVTWQSLSWERVDLRQQNARANEKLARIVPADEWLTPVAGGWTSAPIDLSEFDGDSVIFKAVGTSSDGRPVSAWSAPVTSPRHPSEISRR